jgi:hypothetical protein
MIEQLILHLVGDYVTQSDWMANNKTKRHWPAFVHAVIYSLPFLLLRPSWAAFAVILGTHFLIDRYRLAAFVVKWKNIIGDAEYWQSHNLHIREVVIPKFSTGTGYPEGVPPFLSVWLLIAVDNTLHLAINYAALRLL